MTGLLLATSVPLFAKPAAHAVTTQCKAGEKPLYSCLFGHNIGSVCGSKGAIHYRYGPAGHPGIDLANDARWSNIRTGFIVGGGSGRQTHIRFTHDHYSYVVFWAFAGEYTVEPGKQWSGIVVADPQGGQTVLSCRGHALISDDPVDDLYSFAPSAVSGDLEDKDSDFDVWF